MSLVLLDPALRDARREVDKQTDRVAAIIACAIVDEVLTRALQRRLILTSDVKEQLFSSEKNAPLTSFRNKINVAFAVGLLNNAVRTDLHLVRRIRNRFAHELEPRSFADKKIAAWCSSLNAPSKIKHPRPRYLYVAFGAAAACMALEQIEMRLVHLMRQSETRAAMQAAMDAMNEAIIRYASKHS
jgi:DNA-binding MltR family transcriptional regulator